MLADGLTKALPPNKWPIFINQMGLQQGKLRNHQEIDLQLLGDTLYDVQPELGSS
jgi:hypothetical protein